MVNKKQIGGQDFCECGHKEFHHRRSFDGKDICCMDCDCEEFRRVVLTTPLDEKDIGEIK